MLKKIQCDWRLTDGLIEPIRIGSPKTVLDALVHTGFSSDDGTIIDRLKNEWVCRREWRYFATFTNVMPADVRKFLKLDGLCGAYRIVFNGTLLYAGENICIELEVTSIAKDADNIIEIVFPPEDNSAMYSTCGFRGSMFIRDTGSTAIRSFNMHLLPDGEWRSEVALSSTESREFEFRYAIERDGGKVERTLREVVTEGDAVLSHTPFGGARVNSRCDITLTIMDGIRVIDESYYTEYISDLNAPVRGFMADTLNEVEAAANAGANCVCCRDSALGVRTFAGERELTLVEYLPSLATTARSAAQPYDKLVEMAGGDEFALEGDYLWRLSGGEKPDVKADSIMSLCDVSRYLQAVELRETAERARLKREMLLIGGAFDARPACASSALFDFDGSARPAYTALKHAWRGEHAFAKVPTDENADGIVAVPIFYVCDSDCPAATVNARAYSIDGRELVSASYPVLGRATDVVGRLCVDAPDDGILLIRVTIMRFGEVEYTSDCAIIRADALDSLKKTQILITDDCIENVGNVCAVGVHVASANYFGFMLPKQKIKSDSARKPRVEGLNIYL